MKFFSPKFCTFGRVFFRKNVSVQNINIAPILKTEDFQPQIWYV